MTKSVLSLVASPKYEGDEGLHLLRHLLAELLLAADQQHWSRVRQLDRICMSVVQQVRVEGINERAELVEILSNMKFVYGYLLERCGLVDYSHEVAERR
jgi:flagellar protein FliT